MAIKQEKVNDKSVAALAIRFASLFGGQSTTESKLAGLQDLCHTCGIPEHEIPTSINKCKKLLKTKHVNIFDVIEARDAHTVVAPDLIFDSVRDLARYSRRNNKVFPRVQAKKDGLLNLMLRQIG